MRYCDAALTYTLPQSSGRDYERILIWLVHINEAQPMDLKLANFEIEKIAYKLARE